jgi:hypothetical protein
MISRLTFALPAALLGAALLTPSAHAQGRGMRASGAVPRSRSSFRLGGRNGLARQSHRRFLNDPAFLFPPYFYPDGDFEDGTDTPETRPVQVLVAQSAQPSPTPALTANPVEPLLLEIHDGQWVRVPTGSEMQALPQSAKPDPAKASSLHPGIIELPEAAQPLSELPPAVIVFRDGHREEMGKYMIRGDELYTTADYWSTGSWTRKIPLAELDIPASLKLNKERGTKFNLPSGPNEVVVRF